MTAEEPLTTPVAAMRRVRGRVWVFTGGQPLVRREAFSTIIIDAVAGL